MAWCFEDEADRYADHVLDLLVENEAIAPSLWPLEVANVLLSAERGRRLTEADTSKFVHILSQLPITVDQETVDRALSEILFLGRKYELSAYDAAYLELAMREGVELATRDKELRKAATKCGVKLVT